MTWQQYFEQKRAEGDTRLKSEVYRDWYTEYGNQQQPPAPPEWRDSPEDD